MSRQIEQIGRVVEFDWNIIDQLANTICNMRSLRAISVRAHNIYVFEVNILLFSILFDPRIGILSLVQRGKLKSLAQHKYFQ